MSFFVLIILHSIEFNKKNSPNRLLKGSRNLKSGLVKNLEAKH